MKKTVSLLFLFLCATVFAQAPDVQWVKTYGGTLEDASSDIKQTPDGGYVVFGLSKSTNGQVTANHGGYDYWLLKLNSIGTIEWQKTYGGAAPDHGGSVQLTSDGGYIMGGYTYSDNGDIAVNNGVTDIWIVKVDAAGNLEWQKSLGGSLSEQGGGVQQTSDGGYLVSGITYSSDGDVTSNHGLYDYWLVKLNATGALQWQKTYGGSNNDFLGSVQQSSDGGYIILGHTASNDGDVTGNHGGYSDGWIVKTNSSGVIEWQKTYGGTGDDRTYAIIKTTDGGYILSGRTNSADGDVTQPLAGNYDCWVVKINSAGVIEWQKTYGGSNGDEVLSIQQTADNGYVFSGLTTSNNGDVSNNSGSYDGWIVKLAQNGTLEWEKCLGSTLIDIAYCIQQTSDGWYVVSGLSGGNFPDYHGGTMDYLVYKLGPNLSTDTFQNEAIVLSPNPVSDTLYINAAFKLDNNATIFDMLGNAMPTVIENNTVATPHLQSGIYFIAFRDENNLAFHKKFIKH